MLAAKQKVGKMTSYNTSLECCTKKKTRIDYCNNIMPSVIPHSELSVLNWRNLSLEDSVTQVVWEMKRCAREAANSERADLLTKARNTFLWHERTWRNIMLSVACSCLQVNKGGYHRRTSHQSAAGWMLQTAPASSYQGHFSWCRADSLHSAGAQPCNITASSCSPDTFLWGKGVCDRFALQRQAI